MGIRLAALGAAGAPLIWNGLTPCKQKISNRHVQHQRKNFMNELTCTAQVAFICMVNNNNITPKEGKKTVI